MNRTRRFQPRALALAVLCLLWCLALPGAAQDGGRGGEKLDALLQSVLATSDGVASRGSLVGLPKGAGSSSLVTVLVKVQDDGEEARRFAERRNGRVTSRHGDILVMEVPVGDLGGLAAYESVERIEASMALLPTMDRARATAGANVDAVVQANPVATGRGVLVGVIDTGVDTTLPAFQDEQGGSRILHFWDQLQEDPQRRPTVRTPEGTIRTYDYGSEWTAADIDAGTFVFRDPGFHGTHVAGIIAGRDAGFPGVAPESRLLVVRNGSGTGYEDIWQGAGTGSTLDAYEYLLSRAREIGLPLVVNQSQGTGMGPHDGSTLFEQALQNDVEQRNLITCISAGNTQQQGRHAHVTVPANGSVTVRLRFAEYGASSDRILYNSIDAWLRGGAQPTLTVRRFTDGTFTTLAGSSATIPYAAEGTFDTGTGRDFLIAKELPSASNGDDRFLMTYQTGQAETFYELEFTNTSGQASELDLYVQRDTESYFLTGATASGTLGVPGTTPGAITVGAYTTRSSYTDVTGTLQTVSETEGSLANFSSLGPPRAPDRYAGNNAVKPDVCAPGHVVVSQIASDRSNILSILGEAAIFQDDQHLAISGTSMATPVVCGVVALLLQDRPTATVDEIKSLLFARARSDSFTGTVPNASYGHGKVDASAFEDVVSPQPRIFSLERDAADESVLVVVGAQFAATNEVYLNGVRLSADQVEWQDQGRIVIRNVPTTNIRTVAVVNTKAPEGEQVALLQIGGAQAAPTQVDTSACFIATAAYGSDLEPQVMALRRFRDRHLMGHAPGRWLVSAYYTLSPPLAKLIAGSESLRFAARCGLYPLVWSVAHPAAATLLAVAVLAGLIARRRRRRA